MYQHSNPPPPPPPSRKIGDYNLVTAKSMRKLTDSKNKKGKIDQRVFRKIRRSARKKQESVRFNFMNKDTLQECFNRGFSITRHKISLIPDHLGYTVSW